ncbi:MAG: hypothetical protein ACI97A_000992 [Planctomycetota bacterium]|jgi:hypothetical protein
MTNLQPPSTSATVLLTLATIGAFVALARFIRTNQKTEIATSRGQALGRAVAFSLLAILAVAVGLRLSGIDNRGMTHVEAYVPGLELPADISTPPPRYSLSDVLMYHFHDEPHPQAYYLLMHAWTRLCGTSLQSIRLPSLIFNVLSIALLFFLVRRESSTGAGLLAATLMACHGHQIYWSQQARMYAMGEFCGLVSTWALLSLVRGNQRPSIQLLYVLSAWLGVATKIFFWPFLAAQMLLMACLRDSKGKHYKTIFRLQACVVILGTPLWTHALYRARSAPLAGPSAGFAGQFFGLGFLFDTDSYSLPPVDIPMIPWFVAIALTVMGVAMANRKCKAPQGKAQALMPFSTLAIMSVSTAVFICGLAVTATSRQPYLFLSALLPIGALLLPWFQGHVAEILGSRIAPLLTRNQAMLFLILSVVPFMLLFCVGAVSPILKTRGMITFVPFLLAAVAIGWSKFLSRPVGVALIVLAFGWPMYRSIEYFNERPEPNAHRQITAQLMEDLETGDLIFIKKNDWVTTPSLYHLFQEKERLVAEDWGRVAIAAPKSRIWVLTYSDIPAPPALLESVSTRPIITSHHSRRCLATLYGRLP